MKYTEDHEWLKAEGDTVTVGITEYAAEQLGDVVFVELPDADKTLEKGDEAAVIESVKAASEILAPLNGTIVAVNEALADAPELVSQDPLGEGWFFKMKISDPSALNDLMDEDAYKAHIS